MTVVHEPRTVETSVETVVQETPEVRTLRLKLPQGVDFHFEPGQWAQLSFPSAHEQKRSFSMSGSPLESGRVEVTLNATGEFSSKLYAARPGDKVVVSGPFGKWYYSDDVRHAVLISGGTGITPFRSIARYVAAKKLPNELTIVYSARTEAELIFRKELESLRRPNIRVRLHVTRPEKGAAWTGATGRITLQTLRDEAPDFDEATFFLCGPNGLVDDISRVLLQAGVPRERVRREHWGEFKI